MDFCASFLDFGKALNGFWWTSYRRAIFMMRSNLTTVLPTTMPSTSLRMLSTDIWIATSWMFFRLQFIPFSWLVATFFLLSAHQARSQHSTFYSLYVDFCASFLNFEKAMEGFRRDLSWHAIPTTRSNLPTVLRTTIPSNTLPMLPTDIWIATSWNGFW